MTPCYQSLISSFNLFGQFKMSMFYQFKEKLFSQTETTLVWIFNSVVSQRGETSYIAQPGQSNIMLSYLIPKSLTDGSITLFTHILTSLIFHGCAFLHLSFSVFGARMHCSKLHNSDLAKLVASTVNEKGLLFFSETDTRREIGFSISDLSDVALSCVSFTLLFSRSFYWKWLRDKVQWESKQVSKSWDSNPGVLHGRWRILPLHYPASIYLFFSTCNVAVPKEP